MESNLEVHWTLEGASDRVTQRARAWTGVGVERSIGLRRRVTALLLPLLFGACTTTQTTSTTTWGEGYGSPELLGQVTWVRETEKDEHGNPVGGAVLGAVVGGLFGHAVGGGTGAVVGAAGGAGAGAALSQGSSEKRFYDVGVRLDDGEERVFRFPDTAPFVVGERVGVSGNTLRPVGAAVAGAPPGPPPAYVPPPPPPPGAPPPP